VDDSRINVSAPYPIINGLSDHDAQNFTIKICIKNKQISFKALNKINGLGINFAV